MKIVITNTAVLNTGDAAILFASMDILRQAFLGLGPLEISVYDQQAEAAQKYYPDLCFQPVLYDQLTRASGEKHRKLQAVRVLAAAFLWRSPAHAVGKWLAPRALHRTLDEFAGADIIVSAGGTYLVPHYRILPKLLDLLVARALGRPFVLFTQSLGPFPDRRRSLLYFVLRSARAILVRDARSYRHLLDFGIRPDRIAECADAAFALARPKSGDADSAGKGRNLRIAISVRDWPHIGTDSAEGMARYIRAMAQTVEWLIERGDAEVTFLSTCQGVTEYWTDDSSVADLIVAELAPGIGQKIRIDRDFHDPEALIGQLATFDLVIATRMHVAILALGAGVPVLAIAYEFKTVELFKRLGISGLVHDIETVTSKDLRAAVDNLIRERVGVRSSLAPTIERERNSAFSAGRYIREAVRPVS